jgi:hypothetical protein
MKRRWAAAICLTLACCDQRAAPIVAYRHPTDALASMLPLSMFGIYRCASLQKESGLDVVVGIPIDQCYKMQPAKRFRGIWINQFEESIFFDGARDANSVKAEMRRRLGTPAAYEEWLGWPEKMEPPLSRNMRMVFLDFIGRRTAYPGRYGHMGSSRSEIVVDRVISARVIYRSSMPYIEDELRAR